MSYLKQVSRRCLEMGIICGGGQKGAVSRIAADRFGRLYNHCLVTALPCQKIPLRSEAGVRGDLNRERSKGGALVERGAAGEKGKER